MTTFRDLVQRADDLAAPEIDVDALVLRGERHLRRRRLGAVIAAAVIALVAIVGGVLVGGGDPRSNGPIDRPDRRDEAPVPARKIVYGDGVQGRAIHFGDDVVETGIAFAHMDATDAGFVYVTGGYRGDGRVWFSDGRAPEQIGSHACNAPHGYPSTVVTANTGSLAAWFTCMKGAAQSLIVFDTASRRVVLSQELAACTAKHSCTLDTLIGKHVYFTQLDRPAGAGTRLAVRTMVLDVDTGTATVSTPEAYADDIRGHRRGLVVGDSWQAGTANTGVGQDFEVVGPKLVPSLRIGNGDPVLTAAFDTTTRRPVDLRVPSGYVGASGFEVFEWLDDHTVALVAGSGWPEGRGYGDILTCRLSDGHCELTVRGHGGDEGAPVRVVPGSGLPG